MPVKAEMSQNGSKPTIEILDSTLRDGLQKVKTHAEEEDRVEYIHRAVEIFPPNTIFEAGFGDSNETVQKLFRALAGADFIDRVTVFGRTRNANVKTAKEDEGLQTLLAMETPIVTLVGKSDTANVIDALHTSLEENLDMIHGSVELMAQEGRRVIYDAEHFFDGTKRDPEYALKTIRAAAEGGASTLVLCDTNGGNLPGYISEWVTRVKEDEIIQSLNPNIQIGIHTHHDLDLAVANTLVAMDAGATHIQGTINGWGERIGNANLFVLMHIMRKFGIGNIQMTDEQMKQFKSLSNETARGFHIPLNPLWPLTGEDAFATSSGMHLTQNPGLYEHDDPEAFGNRRKRYISSQIGRTGIQIIMDEKGLPSDRLIAGLVAKTVKSKENEGYMYSLAEGSSDLLLLRAIPDYEIPFTVEPQADGPDESRLVHILSSDGLKDITTGVLPKSTDPSDLFSSLKGALLPEYPQLGEVHFTDHYEIKKGGGKVRIMVETSNGYGPVTTMGVSDSEVDAAWIAVSDALEYAIAHQKKQSDDQKAKPKVDEKTSEHNGKVNGKVRIPAEPQFTIAQDPVLK